jgi:hypothetical protein
MDQHYTPEEFARSIVNGLICRAPRRAADFAAGEGALLSAIRERWPKTYLAATDLSRLAVKKLRQRFRNAKAEQCNFLDESSRKRVCFLGAAHKKFSLIFLNPPFSNRGGGKCPVTLGDESIACSPALAFVIASLRYLSRRGRLIAILPSSCLTSQRDSSALTEILKSHDVQLLCDRKDVRFGKCSVEVVVVAISRREGLTSAGAFRIGLSKMRGGIKTQLTKNSISVSVFRGTVQMAPPPRTVTSGGIPLVHTTHLKSRSVEISRMIEVAHASTSGPMILLPRVGRPNIDKTCLYLSDARIALSDCVIAIRFNSAAAAKLVFSLLISNERLLLGSYGGCCAKYLTLAGLSVMLRSLGIITEVCRVDQASTDSAAKVA